MVVSNFFATHKLQMHAETTELRLGIHSSLRRLMLSHRSHGVSKLPIHPCMHAHVHNNLTCIGRLADGNSKIRG